MSTRIASDYGHGTWCPITQGRERLAAEDERTSMELAIRCGLKSARGDAPKPLVPSGKPRPQGPRIRNRRKGG
jgi:hypothetical protein